MSEETEKNPLEVFLEKMEELLSHQVEQNKDLQSTINKYQTLMSKIDQERLTNQEEFKNLSEKLPQEILRIHEQSLNTMDNHSTRIERILKNLNSQLYDAIENATENISGVELNLNEKDRKALSDTENQIKKFNFNYYLLVGIIALSFLTISITFYVASSFYKSSVLSKEEVRQNVLDDIQASQQAIYSVSYFQALENERQIVDTWKNANPNDSKSYIKFRNSRIKSLEDKGIPYFETLISDETSDGFGMKFKK